MILGGDHVVPSHASRYGSRRCKSCSHGELRKRIPPMRRLLSLSSRPLYCKGALREYHNLSSFLSHNQAFRCFKIKKLGKVSSLRTCLPTEVPQARYKCKKQQGRSHHRDWDRTDCTMLSLRFLNANPPVLQGLHEPPHHPVFN